jgi:putative nucleotidyltransferase with HDIG domain
MTFLTIYVRRQRSFSHDPRDLGLIAALFLMFLFGARLTIPGHTIFPYMLPLAAYGMTISTLYGAEPALVTMLPLAVLITYGLPFSLELTLYYTLTGFFGVFVLGRALRVATFFTAAAAISLSGVGVILVYRFSNPSTDWIGLITLVAAALFNGIASSGSTLILQFFLAQMLGKTTPLQLIELSRPDHPLLQLLLRNAPGTYQHSLQVANLVEQAAEQIGADPLLTRVGALYHDIGKAVNAVFFIENQGPGNLDSHDDLDPATSASLVIDHVTSGLELARKYHLPRRIQDFIAEHHGTMVTRYQYAKALKGSNGDESKVDISKFRYPGPRPHSRETALLMLADGCEAHIRADRPKDEDELRSLIKNLVRERVANGALDDADLTLRDLDSVVNSFTATLRGVYHPRIQYPRLEPVPEALEAQTPPSKAEPVDGSGPSTDVESSSPSVG